MRDIFTLILISSLFTGFIMLLLCTYDLRLGKHLSPKKRSAVADLTLALQPAILLLAIMFSMIPPHEVATGVSTGTVVDGFTVPVTATEVSTTVDSTVGVTVSYGIDFGIIFGVLTLIWLAGVAVTALYKIVSYLRFVHNLKKSLMKCDYDASVPVFKSPKATSPFLMGFFRAKIILPEKPMDEGELELAIKHELIHHNRHDIQKKFWAELLKCINWFNPAFYVFANKLSELSELTVDEILSSDLDHTQKKAYGGLLLKFASAGTGSIFCSELSKAASNLAARLEVIMQESRNKITRKEKIILATLAVLVVAVVGLSIGICAAAMPEDAGSDLAPGETRIIEIDESKTIEIYGIEQEPADTYILLPDVGEKLDEDSVTGDIPTRGMYLCNLTKDEDGNLTFENVALTNGEMLVMAVDYAITISSGSEVEIYITPNFSMDYSNTDGNGEHIGVGYILDGEAVELFNGFIQEEGIRVSFTVEEAGEYQLYVANYSAGMQNYESIEVEID
ncbi:MAG: M56 family metallopeptidase [Oscillospiraceae bacterium]|nr:M56 family metallopeptidase [Oscillospiraceae bacterium]